MIVKSKPFLRLGSAVLALVLVASSGMVSAEEKMSAKDMTLHHMHMMINHGIEMAAEGSNMVMLAQMNMAPGVDDASDGHGKMMIAQGKKLIEDMMSGAAMKDLHGQGTGIDDPTMAYTHELGDAALAYIAVLEKMTAAPPHDHGH